MGRGVRPLGSVSSARSAEASGIASMAVVRLCDRVLIASYSHSANRPADEIEAKIGQVLLTNAAAIHPRLSVTDKDIGTIHYESDRYAMYIIVAAHDYPQRTAFKCISELRERFEHDLGEELHKAQEGGLSRASHRMMAELCTKFADAASVDKTLGLMREVDEVKGIVGETVQHLLATHENLEVLEDRSEQLKAQTQTFQRTVRLRLYRPKAYVCTEAGTFPYVPVDPDIPWPGYERRYAQP